MTDEETVRVWLVEREYNTKGMIVLVYATTDGSRYLRKQFSEHMLTKKDVTAGIDAEIDRLESTHDDDRDRFAAEAQRMADQHDPEDPV
jgi:hypothetical protein